MSDAETPETTTAAGAAPVAAEASASDASSQTIADGGATPDVPTEHVVEESGRELNAAESLEFPTAWHRDAFIAATRREIEGATIRGLKDHLVNAERELERVLGLAGSKPKQTRPRGAGKQTR